MMKRKSFFYVAILFLFTAIALGAVTDWPQYRGTKGDGISTETGLLKTWPAEGPKVLWKVPIGDGYSGVSVVGGRLYTMDAKGQDEFVVCLDAASGKEIWRFRSDANFSNDQGNGPRGTPTVEGNAVYTLGAQASLYALNVKDGTKIWGHDLKKEFGAKIPIWGVSSSPLIDGDLVIVPVGGADGNAIMAFNKKSGALAWKSQSDEPGYSSPMIVTVNGIRQLIVFSGTALFSVSPADGKLFWKYPWKTDWFVNAAVPLFIPEDKLFISTSYDHGAALLKVNATKAKVSVEELWLTKGMKNHFNTSVYHNGYIYGFDNALLKCIDAKTGDEKWKKGGLGKGSLILADGHLIVLGERGQLVLIEATPEALKEKSSIQAMNGKCWTMPSISNGKLYLRNQKELICMNLT